MEARAAAAEGAAALIVCAAEGAPETDVGRRVHRDDVIGAAGGALDGAAPIAKTAVPSEGLRSGFPLAGGGLGPWRFSAALVSDGRSAVGGRLLSRGDAVRFSRGEPLRDGVSLAAVFGEVAPLTAVTPPPTIDV